MRRDIKLWCACCGEIDLYKQILRIRSVVAHDTFTVYDCVCLVNVQLFSTLTSCFSKHLFHPLHYSLYLSTSDCTILHNYIIHINGFSSVFISVHKTHTRLFCFDK